MQSQNSLMRVNHNASQLGVVVVVVVNSEYPDAPCVTADSIYLRVYHLVVLVLYRTAHRTA